MSKYGTIPAASSPSPTTPEGRRGGSTALDITCRADDVPGSCASLASRCRPWRELADPSALSVPGGFADAYHRARAILAHFADNYKFVFLVVLAVSLLWPPFCLPIVLPCFFIMRAKVFPVHLALTLLLLVLIGATASVLGSLPVGLLLVLVHAVLHLPTDSVDKEAGRGSAAELPSTNC